MKKYLLDTNICIHFIKGQYNIREQILSSGIENCFISEITIAELKYGIEKSMSEYKERNKTAVNNFINSFSIIPILSCLDVYATEKVRLEKSGLIIDDFDLLIGASAIANDMTLITRNITHLERLENISLENWID